MAERSRDDRPVHVRFGDEDDYYSDTPAEPQDEVYHRRAPPRSRRSSTRNSSSRSEREHLRRVSGRFDRRTSRGLDDYAPRRVPRERVSRYDQGHTVRRAFTSRRPWLEGRDRSGDDTHARRVRMDRRGGSRPAKRRSNPSAAYLEGRPRQVVAESMPSDFGVPYSTSPERLEEDDGQKENPQPGSFYSDLEFARRPPPPPPPIYYSEPEEADRRRRYSDRRRRSTHDSEADRTDGAPEYSDSRSESELSEDDTSSSSDGTVMSREQRRVYDDLEKFQQFDFGSSSFHIGSSIDSSKDGDSTIDSNDIELLSDPIQTKTSKAISIYSSQYTGSAELGGPHSATLTAVHDPKGQHQALFKWLHIRQEVLNFDDFWLEISRNLRLSDLQTSAIAKLRASVKRNCIKTRPNPEGSQVGYMAPIAMEVPLNSSRDTTKQKSASVRWICMPYFSLKPYSGLQAASDPSSFPPQTLWQTRYSRSGKSRDMEQAVRQISTGNGNECFHVEQLWCLVIDNSLLVTCGSMARSSLRGESLVVNSEPARNPAAATNIGKIRVTHEESIVWSFTAEECPTWFSFIKHFNSFWPRLVEFKHRKHTIKPEDWPEILNLINRPRGSVTLTLHLKRHSDLPTRGVLSPEISPEISTDAASQKQTAKMREPLHVLTLFSGKSKSQSLAGMAEAHSDDLNERLSTANIFLTRTTNYRTQKIYQKGYESTRELVRQTLDIKAAHAEEQLNTAEQRLCREQIDLFNVADILFQLFLPPSFDGPTVKKFWGAIWTLLKKPVEKDGDSRRRFVKDTRAEPGSLVSRILAFQDIFSHASPSEKAKIDVPREFGTAWLHVIAAMIYASDDSSGWYNHLGEAQRLIEEGMGKMVQGMTRSSLLDKAAFLPMETLPLILHELLRDQVGKSDDICDTYSQFLDFLESEITSKSASRSFENQIDLAQQEMAAVRSTLWRQRCLINTIRKSIPSSKDEDMRNATEELRRNGANLRSLAAGRMYPSGQDLYAAEPPNPRIVRKEANIGWMEYGADYPDSDSDSGDFVDDLAKAAKLSPTDTGGFRALLFMECSRLIDQREYEFKRFSDHAEDLKQAVSFKIGMTRDRQEDAIYAFTIVTIIFLPLSSVAGIFGMNTADVRDMGQTQWLYWAVAIPVTVVVIVGGLWWMGELGNMVAWMTGRPRGSRAANYPGSAMPPPLPGSYYESRPVVTEERYVERIPEMDTAASTRMSAYRSEYAPTMRSRAPQRYMDRESYR